MSSSKPTVAFYGLGAMGGGMAVNLAKNGFPVCGYDLYQPSIDKLLAVGGTSEKTPKLVAEKADFAVIMVANAYQAEALLFEGPDAAIHGMGKGKMVILCSTCPPAFLHELRKRLDAEGRSDVRLIDCPVSGGTIRAADGTLSIFAAGEALDVDGAKQVLDCMSGNLYRVEGGISSGTKVKTIHQLLAATNIIAASEAMGLAATVGLNTPAVFEHIKAGSGTSFMFENRAPHMLADDWSPLSALGIILKDAGIVTATARSIPFSTPLASAAEQLYLAGQDAGLLRDDDAKLVTLYLPTASPSLVKDAATADVRMSASHQVSAASVDDLLAGVHLAASVEALAFCKALGMSTRYLYDIISKAAGWSRVFTDYMPAMLERDEWSLRHCEGADAVRERLERVVDRCRALGYPCPMASAALQQFYFARLSK